MIYMAFDPSDLQTDYWNTDKLDIFWGFVRWFLSFNMPWIMILVALLLTFGVLAILVSMFFPSKDDDDTDDYEYWRY